MSALAFVMGSPPSFSWVREGPNGSVEEVPFTLSWRPGDGTLGNAELVPVSPLAANSRHRIGFQEQGGKPFTLTSFTTGTLQDGHPPPAPKVKVGKIVPFVSPREVRPPGCIVWTGFARLTARSEGAATYLLRDGEKILAAGLPDEARLGFLCPAADREVQATLTAVDLAGNMSEPVPVTFEERCVDSSRQGGYSTLGGTGGLLLAALASRVLAWRRRRAE